MADDTTRSNGTLRPIGSNAKLVRELSRTPEGFYFLLALIVEAGLFLMFLRGQSSAERYAALIFMVIALVALLLFYSAERRRWYGFRQIQLSARAVPESMTAAPIKTEEAERSPDLMTAPDGTFVYAPPPANWTIEMRTGERELELAYERQGAGPPPPGAELRAFRQGPIVVFRTLRTHRLAYLPGKSLVNGRPAIAMLNEDFWDQVGMYSVSKRGGVMRDMPAQHVFAAVLAGLIQAGLKVETIRVAPSEVGGRVTLTACCSNRGAHVMIDGTEVDSTAVETRLHVVEYANFVYVIQTSHLIGAPESEASEADISRIVGSFRAAFAANAAEREQADAQEADATYDQVMRAQVSDLLVLKANVLCGQMRTPSGSVRVLERQVENVRLLEGYAKAFPDYVPDDVAAMLTEFRSLAEQAFDGQPAALAEFIRRREAETEQAGPSEQPEPAALPDP